MHKVTLFHLALATAALLPAGLHAQVTVEPASLAFFYQTGQPIPPGKTIQVSNPSAAQISIGVQVPGAVAQWLFVSTNNSSSTLFPVSVQIVPGQLAPGNYTGTVVLTPAGGTAVNVPVSLSVSSTPILIPSSDSLTFNHTLGAAAPPDQTISIQSSSTALTYSASASVQSGGVNWLSIVASSAFTPSDLRVVVNPSGLPVGTYTGTVTLLATGSTLPITVNVTLRVQPESRLTLSPAAVQFDYQVNGPAPQPIVVSATVSGTQVAVTAAVTTQTGGPWLSVDPITATTPAGLSLRVNPIGLAAGLYNGTLTVSSPSVINSPQTIPVTLRVTTDPLIQASPASLTFTAQTPGQNPPARLITLSTIGNPVSVTAAVTTTAGGSWLIASPVGTAVNTPGVIQVRVVPGSLAPGTYTGAVTLSGTAANSPLTVPVTMVITASPVLRTSLTRMAFAYQVGAAVPPAQNLQITSTGTAVAYTATATTVAGGGWLAVTPAAATTPSDLQVSVNPAALTPGTYSGTVTITPGDANSPPVMVPVELVISTTPLLTVPQTPLTFNYSAGGTPPANQTFVVGSSGTPLNFEAVPLTANGGNWLVLAPATGATGTQVTVGVNFAGLLDGVYTGLIRITSTGVANSPVYVPVVLNVSFSSQFTVTPALLEFTQRIGAAAPAAQRIQIRSAGNLLISYAAAVTTTSGQSWLTLSKSSGLTPDDIDVSVNAAGLTEGRYVGTITVTSAQASNSPLSVPVILTVERVRPNLQASSDNLTFNFVPGGSPSVGQTLQVTSGGDPIDFTIATATATGGPWLAVNTNNGRTPASVTVTVNPAGLSAGTYQGTVTLASTAAANSPRIINVTFTVGALVAPTVGGVVNAASFLPTAAVPGMIITIGGANLGPANGLGLTLTAQGTVATRLGNTRVLFDGIPSPLLFVNARQINAVVPYEIAGRLSTNLQVEVDGTLTTSLTLRVLDASPAIFSQNSTGAGPGAILNQNGSVNAAGNPADRGAVVVIYATGEGQTLPGGVTGSVTGTTLKSPVLPVRILIGGLEAEVQYAGSAPGFVSGLMQINAVVPAGVTPGANVPIQVAVGSTLSAPGITLAVR